MNFKNKKLNLPKFTISFEEKMEEIENLNKNFLLGNVRRIEVLRKCYEFLSDLLTEEKLLVILESASFDDVDTKELELLFFMIKTEYERPLEEATVKREQEKINGIFKNTNISDIIKIYEKANGKS